MADRQTNPISETLLFHLRHGYHLRKIARLAGVDRSQLQRFARGERNISVATADKLAVAMGLCLLPAPPPVEQRP
jgi:transcriptional regulator with XRE-family HTH domain